MTWQTKNSKEFSFVVLKQYASKFVFMLRHRLFNLTPNMLEVGHPKRSYSDACHKIFNFTQEYLTFSMPSC